MIDETAPLKTLSGNAKRKMRTASRLYAVQALFQMEHSSQTVEVVRHEFLEHRFGATYDGTEMLDGDVDLFRKIMEDAENWQAKIDQMPAAGAELVQSDTPPKVVIVEYVGVAQAFFPEGKESQFVNAVLDHMAREAQPEAF